MANDHDIIIEAAPLPVMPYGLVTVCAWCERVKGSDDSWHEVASLRHLKRLRVVTHGICPTCMHHLMNEAIPHLPCAS